MTRFESIISDAKPVVPARLQATMPEPISSRKAGEGGSVFSDALESSIRGAGPANPHPRLQQTSFSSSREASTHPGNVDAKKQRNWFQAAVKALWSDAWLILTIVFLGAFLGYLYTVRFCAPLYRVQASIEIQNNKSGAHIEALAHVLQSQSLVNGVLSSMSAGSRQSLVEHSSVRLFSPSDPDEILHERLEATAIPSAGIIDIAFTTPNRFAGVRFVNGLIDGLAKREQEQKSLPRSLNEDWNSQRDRSANQITVIDPAIAAPDPVAPNMVDNLLFAGGVGLLLGILVALTRHLANGTFQGPGSVREVLGMRELGSIPERKLLGPAGSDVAHAGVQMDANDESLRYLRSSLLYHPGKQQVRFLAFTSAAPGEGKTTVVANLSMSLAATGRRVLVIDGDLRRPRLHKLLRVPAGPGLADLLRRDPSAPPASLSRYVNPTSFQNLYILPPGTAGTDAPELLAGPHLFQLFRELSKSFDFVLIDTPPLLACSDARNYARAVEGVVLVVRSSETQKRAALVARDMLLQDGATLIGTVLTGWRQNYPAYNYAPAPTYSKA